MLVVVHYSERYAIKYLLQLLVSPLPLVRHCLVAPRYVSSVASAAVLCFALQLAAAKFVARLYNAIYRLKSDDCFLWTDANDRKPSKIDKRIIARCAVCFSTAVR